MSNPIPVKFSAMDMLKGSIKDGEVRRYPSEMRAWRPPEDLPGLRPAERGRCYPVKGWLGSGRESIPIVPGCGKLSELALGDALAGDLVLLLCAPKGELTLLTVEVA